VQQVRYLEQASNSLMFSHFLFTEGGISLSAAILFVLFAAIQPHRVCELNFWLVGSGKALIFKSASPLLWAVPREYAALDGP